MDRVIVQIEGCTDCVMVVGRGAETASEVAAAAAMAQVWPGWTLEVGQSGDCWYSKWPCEACERRSAGERYQMFAVRTVATAVPPPRVTFTRAEVAVHAWKSARLMLIFAALAAAWLIMFAVAGCQGGRDGQPQPSPTVTPWEIRKAVQEGLDPGCLVTDQPVAGECAEGGLLPLCPDLGPVGCLRRDGRGGWWYLPPR